MLDSLYSNRDDLIGRRITPQYSRHTLAHEYARLVSASMKMARYGVNLLAKRRRAHRSNHQQKSKNNVDGKSLSPRNRYRKRMSRSLRKYFPTHIGRLNVLLPDENVAFHIDQLVLHVLHPSRM